MKKQRLLIATSNPNKVKEIKESLATDSYEVVSLLDFPEREEVEEPYFTFEENALHKAKSLYADFQVPVLAEDSGLVVDALYGLYSFGKGVDQSFPGVFSARFASLVKADEHLDHNEEANNAVLLEALDSESNRSAHYVSVFCYYDGHKSVFFKGVLVGSIGEEPRGTRGFAYDPLFIPRDNNPEKETYAEMTPTEREVQSHLLQAFEQVLTYLNNPTQHDTQPLFQVGDKLVETDDSPYSETIKNKTVYVLGGWNKESAFGGVVPMRAGRPEDLFVVVEEGIEDPRFASRSKEIIRVVHAYLSGEKEVTRLCYFVESKYFRLVEEPLGQTNESKRLENSALYLRKGGEEDVSNRG